MLNWLPASVLIFLTFSVLLFSPFFSSFSSGPPPTCGGLVLQGPGFSHSALEFPKDCASGALSPLLIGLSPPQTGDNNKNSAVITVNSWHCLGAFYRLGNGLIALYRISFNLHISPVWDAIIPPNFTAEENESQEGQRHCQRLHSKGVVGKESNELWFTNVHYLAIARIIVQSSWTTLVDGYSCMDNYCCFIS